MTANIISILLMLRVLLSIMLQLQINKVQLQLIKIH